MIFTSYQMMKETAVCWHIWLRLASGVWLGLETGHSSQRKTAPEQGGWTYSSWQVDKTAYDGLTTDGRNRKKFMDNNMPNWIEVAINRQ